MEDKSNKYFDDIPRIFKEVMREKFREFIEENKNAPRYVKLRLPERDRYAAN